MKNFPTINALKMGLHTNDIQFLDGDKTLPYALRDGLYHYFAKGTNIQPDCFVLVMTSMKDLGAQA